MPSKRSLKAYAFLSISIVSLGLLPLALDLGGGQIGTLSFLFYTFLFGTFITFALMLAQKKVKNLVELTKNKKRFSTIVLAGIMNYALVAILLTIGTLHTSASIGGVVYRSWALLLVLFIPFILKVRVTSYQVVSLFIGFIAIYIALTQGTLITIAPGYAPYIILLVVAALAAAISNLIIKRESVDVGVQIFLFNLFSVVVVGLAMLLSGTALNVSAAPITIVAALFGGGIAWGLGAYLYFYALKTLEPTIIGSATMLVPFLTFGFAAFLLNEQIQPYYILLAGLVVLGVAIQQMSPKKAPERILDKRAEGYVQIFDITSAFVETKNSAIYDYIKNGSRALGIIGEPGWDYNSLLDGNENSLKTKYDCVFFTTKNPQGNANTDEIEFINEILGLDSGSAALIGVGHPERVESALKEIDNTYRRENLTDSVNSAPKFL